MARGLAPWLAALVMWLVAGAVSGARVGPQRALKSSGIVVKSSQDTALENAGRRILVSISEYTTSCSEGDYKAYRAPDYDIGSDYMKYDLIKEDYIQNSYGDRESWTQISTYSDLAYMSFFVADRSGDDYASVLDIHVYDNDSDELLQTFSAVSCLAVQIDATSRCPGGGSIRIKAFCSSSGSLNCFLRARSTQTSAASYCSSPSPSTPPPLPVPPSSSSGSNVGVIIGAVAGGIAAVLIGAAGALLIVHRRRRRRSQAAANPQAPAPAAFGDPNTVVHLFPPAGSSKSLSGSDLPKAVSSADSWAYASRPPPEAAVPHFDLQHAAELGQGAAAAIAAAAVAAPAAVPLSSPADSQGSLSRRGTSQSLPIAASDPLLAYVTSQLVSASAAGPRSAHDLAAWELRFEDLDISSFLGEGSWGRVYRAQYRGADVAVKILLNDDKAVNAGSAASLLSMSTPVMAQLSREASIMSQLSHPHCIAMVGVTTVPAAVVQEFAARGSLLDVLRAAQEDPAAARELTWARRIAICVGTARGMAYLHGRQPQPVIHRDLKSANVLLTADWTPKVADFGLSKVMTESARSATRAAMNPRWLSPEILKGVAAAPPADVFAFGVVLWELLTWELPWGTTGPWAIVGALGAGERPPIPPRSELPGPPGTADWEGLDAYLTLMQRCWAQEPEDRPTFEEIIRDLDAMAPAEAMADSPPQAPLSPSSTASGRSSRSRRPSSASGDPYGREPWR